MPNPYLLEMRHITKQFPGSIALRDVSFRVQQGTIHGLVGENGAGKTTLMKILSGVYPVESYTGDVVLNGETIRLRSPADAAKKGIGIVPQEISVIEPLTIAENIVVGQWQGRALVDQGKVNRMVHAFLEEYGIPLNPRAIVHALTTAQKQLVMIARALFRKPNVLILDEPTSSLALNEIDNLFVHLRELRRKGLTCVFITHKLTEIFQLTDCTTVLRDGRIAGEFERAEYDEAQIINAMIGRKIENLYPTRESAIGTREVLRVEGLTVPDPSVANRNIVENVSFSLQEGEILGLAGIVGSGRSEVVNAIVGRLPHNGRIFVDGRAVKIHQPSDAKRAGIALLTEDRKKDGLLTNMTVRPNTTLNTLERLTQFGLLNLALEKQLATHYITDLNVRTPSIEQAVVNLSGGNQQKVILAKILMSKPQILFLDEPTKGIDIGAKNEIYKLIFELVKQGLAVVMISSELPELLALCDRFVVLAEGHVVDEFSKSEASEYRVMLGATKTRAALQAKEGVLSNS